MTSIGNRMPNVCTPLEGLIHKPSPERRLLFGISPNNRVSSVSAQTTRSPTSRPVDALVSSSKHIARSLSEYLDVWR